MVGFHDVALYLVQRYPHLATCHFGDAKDSDDDKAPLTVLAKRPWAFPSGSRFKLWQLIIYHCVPVKLNHFLSQPNRGGMESQVGSYEPSTQMCCWTRLFKACRKVNAIFWELVGWLVPPIKHIQETKTIHSWTLQLLNHLCTEILKVSRAQEIFEQSFITGAKYGIPEILEEIIKSYPFALEYLDEGVFKSVVLNRNEKIFNLICETGMHRQLIIRTKDDSNNILHLAGKLAPPHRLSLVSGAALQMQRELHWFKEIEKYAPRAFSESENNDEEKPKMVFIKEHKKLIKEGEKWMKGTAKFYTLAAALIATVVFAAAITIPGGNHDDTGIPNFSKEIAFKVFAVSDALSLFLSIASVLISLSILTTRYAEDDFLFALPRRLIFGLVTLFLSVTFMMIAYSGAIYLLFGEKKAWILITLAALACVPVTLYGILQFPFLVELIYSTYGPGIFGKHSNRLIR
ncbi:ankyrin repeat-containing protein ITN1-like isoform X2 [Vitis riparia]|uniref:ankyrin repeat-containing protein ITN1-like isoform X1 n=1 Tax=Vitis riparia TaxID=96939 RepID=UPI00155A99B6|nr:ankyrin repeat-containing protein ITN1-like isoform X1 [Vitis riparia]XP_034678969.1 ankyrin repeat-containing protein ITN1-like isoform X2 [Vitis riparia]